MHNSKLWLSLSKSIFKIDMNFISKLELLKKIKVGNSNSNSERGVKIQTKFVLLCACTETIFQNRYNIKSFYAVKKPKWKMEFKVNIISK